VGEIIQRDLGEVLYVSQAPRDQVPELRRQAGQASQARRRRQRLGVPHDQLLDARLRALGVGR
jgi:hypothetical protein